MSRYFKELSIFVSIPLMFALLLGGCEVPRLFEEQCKRQCYGAETDFEDRDDCLARCSADLR